MSPGVDVARGVVLDDRYRLETVIGQGGMATVYRASDLVLGRSVAIKLFPPVAEEADDLLRHQAEMRVLAQLSHPGLVTLHDAGSAFAGGPTTQTYLVMELVPGPTLAERLSSGPLPSAHTALVGRQIAEALVVVHAADVVHRDIKPANVLLVDPDGLMGDTGQVGQAALATGPIVKLADFGIARLADGARLTVTGTMLGTATYLSPEQAAGGVIGPATDIYALGLVLLECLTGRKAFTGTVIEVAAARLNTSPAIPADVGPLWTRLLAEMTRRQPGERPSAAEVARRLTDLLQGGPVQEESAGPSVLERWRATVLRRRQAGPPTSNPSRSAGQHGHAPVDRKGRRHDGTHPYSTAEIEAEADRFAREVSGEPAPAATTRRRGRGAFAAFTGVVLILLVGAALAVNNASESQATTDPPSYPAVDGTLGSTLEDLQRSVEP